MRSQGDLGNERKAAQRYLNLLVETFANLPRFQLVIAANELVRLLSDSELPENVDEEVRNEINRAQAWARNHLDSEEAGLVQFVKRHTGISLGEAGSGSA